MERGETRSGRRFAVANSPHEFSLNDLRARHARLFDPIPAITTQLSRVLNRRSLVSQTTARFLFNSRQIRPTLENLFAQLLREHPLEGPDDPGFEIVLVRIFFSISFHKKINSEHVKKPPQGRVWSISHLIS